MALPTPHAAFVAKKAKILSQLSIPDAEYTDASPKGSVDEGIRDLIDEINGWEGLVTTSSCAGRISVFVEGSKKGQSLEEAAEGEGQKKPASAAGGKGGGGAWLFVSHEPVDEEMLRERGGAAGLFGLERGGHGEAEEPGAGSGSERLIHFKFEPMILHILTASLAHAQLVLKAGLAAGFRESGAVSLLDPPVGEPAAPMVAVRSMGLSFESLLGVMDRDGRKRPIVTPEYLKLLVRIGNERFIENDKRIVRFLEALRSGLKDDGEGTGRSRDEQKEARRELKRAEGLRKQAEARDKGEKNKMREVNAYIEGLEADQNLS